MCNGFLFITIAFTEISAEFCGYGVSAPKSDGAMEVAIQGLATCSQQGSSFLQRAFAGHTKVKAVSSYRVDKDASEGEGEEECELVSKRGIMYSCDVHPLQPASDMGALSLSQTNRKLDSGFGSELDFESLIADHYVKEMLSKGDGAIVYVVTSALPAFRDTVLPRVNTSFVLVTGDAVTTLESALGEKHVALADDSRILKWFAQNLDITHPKIVPLPNGLDYHTLKALNKDNWGSKATPKEQESKLLDVWEKAQNFEDRSSVIHDGAFMSSYGDRATIRLELGQQPEVVHKTSPFPSREAFWEDAAKYRFAASPRGTGIDCHRTWELLVLGVVPLLQAGPHNRLFQEHKLPIVEIEFGEWRQLNSDVVKKKLDNAAKIATNRNHANSLPPALKLKYWVDLIRGASK